MRARPRRHRNLDHPRPRQRPPDRRPGRNVVSGADRLARAAGRARSFRQPGRRSIRQRPPGGPDPNGGACPMTGRCEACGAWNSLVEELARASVPAAPGRRGGRRIGFVGLTGESMLPPRRLTGIAELDRVCGGGFVPGSTLLVGGDPGIGKSTLLLQAAAAIAMQPGLSAAYLTGEEAIDQIRLRAARLGIAESPVLLAAEGDVENILATLDRPDAPDLVVVDSIQTMYSEALDSAPGTVSQVRGAAQTLIRAAKRRGFVLVLVGHVTKEGVLAGPRVLEHMVDTVLYFEGERGHQFRILRAVKNRFGATDEIGVFEMSDHGLVEVPNPSALFLSGHGPG